MHPGASAVAGPLALTLLAACGGPSVPGAPSATVTCVTSDGGTPSLVPSCLVDGDGRSNCGASQESCCTSLPVPCGTYFRTYTNHGSGPTGEADPASVSSFRLDKYLVTVGRFRQFVHAAEGGPLYGRPTAGSGKHDHLNKGRGLANAADAGTYEPGWDAAYNADFDLAYFNLTCQGTDTTWTATPGPDERLPMVCETWSEAYAFCIWDGGFLPSEAEWGYAAAGGAEQREYPWGSTAPGTANQYAIYGCNYRGGGGGCGVLAPVGTATLGAGRWGQLDLAGAVYEWLRDSYNGGAYGSPCVDCLLLTSDPSPTALGGAPPGATESELLPTHRVADVAGDRNAAFGFRCARRP